MDHAHILAPVTPAGRFLFMKRIPALSAEQLVAALAELSLPEGVLIGLGAQLVADLNQKIPGLRPFPALSAGDLRIPTTPADVVVRVTGADPGEVLHRSNALLDALPETLLVLDDTATYVYDGGRDLTGYEDGTENPDGDDAVAAAIIPEDPSGLVEGSIIAVQRWVHDLRHFASMSPTEQNHTIGRDRVSNDELEAAPPSAHVKRTAKEDFTPEAFVVRRSMPWSDHRGAGLVFVAFGHSLDPFEALLRRMCGLDDGIVDALFKISRPVNGTVAWCPPVKDGRLDLRALGL